MSILGKRRLTRPKIVLSNRDIFFSCFTDTIYVQNHNLSSNDQEREDAQTYDSCHIEQLKDFKLITKVEEALSIDLNNLGNLKKIHVNDLIWISK